MKKDLTIEQLEGKMYRTLEREQTLMINEDVIELFRMAFEASKVTGEEDVVELNNLI